MYKSENEIVRTKKEKMATNYNKTTITVTIPVREKNHLAGSYLHQVFSEKQMKVQRLNTCTWSLETFLCVLWPAQSEGVFSKPQQLQLKTNSKIV